MNKKKALLINNPCAGVDRKRITPAEIMEQLSAADLDFTVQSTKGQGDATEIVKAMGNDHDVIICCGGDGTLNETMNGVMQLNKRVPVGYIPSGSTNDLATTLGIKKGVEHAAQMILNNKTNTYDVGMFGDKFFNYIACFGAATDLSYNTPQSWKNLLGHSAYMIHGFVIRLIPMIKGFKPTRMRIEYDDGIIEDDIYFGAVSNTTSVAGLAKYDNVKLNDGVFELLIVKGLKRNVDAIGSLIQVINKDYSSDNILFTKTKHLKITCEDKIPWSLDGEYGGDVGNIEIKIIPDAYDIYSDNAEMFVDKAPAAL
ncbi:MAG: YegS/Rv2252/BmrU family lipid kinase [Clostridia bacterium]|nr:YegS/Rv2252/BmrU family lipid kinase [Clostridia bacterium]